MENTNDRIIIFTTVNSKTTTTWVFLDGMTVATRIGNVISYYLLLVIGNFLLSIQ